MYEDDRQNGEGAVTGMTVPNLPENMAELDEYPNCALTKSRPLPSKPDEHARRSYYSEFMEAWLDGCWSNGSTEGNTASCLWIVTHVLAGFSLESEIRCTGRTVNIISCRTDLEEMLQPLCWTKRKCW